MTVIHIESTEQFDELISTESLVVVDFTATWCGPCQMIAPVYEELSGQYSNAVFLKVDVDEVEEVANRYEVNSMPTFLFLKEQKEIERFSSSNKEKLESTLKRLAE